VRAIDFLEKDSVASLVAVYDRAKYLFTLFLVFQTLDISENDKELLLKNLHIFLFIPRGLVKH